MLAAVFTLAGCQNDHPVIDNSWNTGTLTVKEEVLFDETTSQSLNIKASSKPTLTCEAEWLKIGEVKRLTIGLYSVEITVEPNTTGETRVAEISVTEGKESATVTVTQLPGDIVEVRAIDPNEGVLDPEGGTLTIEYAATGVPAANLPEWISGSGTRTLQEGRLSFTYLPNNTGKEREGIIVLAAGKAVTNVTVRQPSL